MSTNKSKKTITKKNNITMPNDPTYVDCLSEDKPLSNQQFFCVSFVSPDNLIEKLELFMFKRFVKTWSINKMKSTSVSFLNFIASKYNLRTDSLLEDFKQFMDAELLNIIQDISIDDDYKNFIEANENELHKTFDKIHNFQTKVRGLKVRGSYQTYEEANQRAKLLRELDPTFDVFVGEVGKWLPWEPEAYKTGHVEYLEPELNKLMQKKQENEQQARDNFRERVKHESEKAIATNKIIAEKNNTKITQDIDSEGRLFSVNVNTSDSIVSTDIDTIKQDMFNTEDVAPSKSDNGLSKLINNPFKQYESLIPTNVSHPDSTNSTDNTDSTSTN